MKALVLCAGLGTRLRPLTERWPKPAVPLLGQPLLRYALATLQRAGVTAFAANTHHLPDVMEATARAEAARAGLGVSVSHEPVIQGTAGGIRGARHFLEGDAFVVWNGDILFAVDLAAVVAAHRASDAAATLVLMAMPAGETYAAVETDGAGRVVRIAGRGPGAASATPWHFTGVHVMSPAVFDFMAPAGEEDINRSVYPRMMEKGLVIRGEVVNAPWSDLGTPARYLAAHAALLSERIPMSAFVGASPFEGLTRRAGLWVCNGAHVLGDVHGPAFVESGAFVAPGARLEGGVSVGARSRVSEGARVARSAIFADTTVAADETLADAIAWEDQRLRASQPG